jgi:hypothetical protein
LSFVETKLKKKNSLKSYLVEKQIDYNEVELMKFSIMNTGSFKIVTPSKKQIIKLKTDFPTKKDLYTLYINDYGNYANLIIKNSDSNIVWTAISNYMVTDESDSSRSKLPVGCYLLSSKGKYRLEMQQDGKLTILSNRDDRIIWISPNPVGPATHVKLRNDGTLVIMNKRNIVWSISNLNGGTSPYTLTLQDNGNLVILDLYNNLIWESKISSFKKNYLI